MTNVNKELSADYTNNMNTISNNNKTITLTGHSFSGSDRRSVFKDSIPENGTHILTIKFT